MGPHNITVRCAWRLIFIQTKLPISISLLYYEDPSCWVMLCPLHAFNRMELVILVRTGRVGLFGNLVLSWSSCHQHHTVSWSNHACAFWTEIFSPNATFFSLPEVSNNNTLMDVEWDFPSVMGNLNQTRSSLRLSNESCIQSSCLFQCLVLRDVCWCSEMLAK